MTRVKICGITNKEDARAAVDYGADALGFVLIPESPRYVGMKPELNDLLLSIPPLITCVGLCRNPTDLLGEYDAYFDAAQFYDEAEPDQNRAWYCDFDLIYACRVRDESSLDEIALRMDWARPMPFAVLLDAYHKDKLGGSGETFNWNLAVEAKKRFNLPIILAGGLTADNVAEAIARVQPYAVDVSSGVEAEPGRKDHAKMKAFIRAVRRADL